MMAYGLINKSSKIIIQVEKYRSDALQDEKVTYTVPVESNPNTATNINTNIINNATLKEDTSNLNDTLDEEANDSKYVKGHYKTKKDNTTSNNYSHKGNTNPYSGKRAYSKK